MQWPIRPQLYAITLAGYFGLSYLSKSDDTLKRTIWGKTPEFVKNIELALGIAAWAVLGTYLGLAEGYDAVTLVLFFLAQLCYIGARQRLAPFNSALTRR